MKPCPVCGTPCPRGDLIEHLRSAHTQAELESAMIVHIEYAKTILEEQQKRRDDDAHD